MAVTSLTIKERRPYADAMLFGDVGEFEQIDGVVNFAVDPSAIANSRLTDLNLAPKNSAGEVEFSSEFRIIKPVDQMKGSHKLFFDVVNRGRPLSLTRINSAVDSDPMGPGNGYLMRQGYTLVWCGWQHDVPEAPGLLRVFVPNASDTNGPVNGRIAVTFQPNETSSVQMLSDRGHIPYPASDLEQADSKLLVYDYDGGPATTIPRTDWSFAALKHGKLEPDASHIILNPGFEPGKVYQCIYTTAHAPVVGLGFAGVRDLISYLRYSDSPDNPCCDDIRYSMAFGSSQSGRFLRHMLYLAMNQDEKDRTVFNGVIAHIAGGRRGEFNQRFGQTSNTVEASTGSIFPFADIDQSDPETGRMDGLLKELKGSARVPKVFFTNTSSEYWGGHGALTHIDTTGTKDITAYDQVRIYHFTGTQHNAGILPLSRTQPTGAVGKHLFNWVDWRPLLRAAVANLDGWVTNNRTPPPSKHPRLDEGTAVPSKSVEAIFQSIPGFGFPKHLRQLARYDFGSSHEIPDNLPPATGAPYPALVSAVDQDGNEVAGIRLPDVAVPLATVTGWNLRHPDSGSPEQMHRIMGSTVPFTLTRKDRQEACDPRPSMEERYSSKDDYLDRVEGVAQDLVSDGYLLDEDVLKVVQMADERFSLIESHAKQAQPAGD